MAAQVCPRPAIRQQTVGADVEGGQPVPVRLGYDQRGAVRGDGHPVRKRQVGGGQPGAAIRGDQGNESGRRFTAGISLSEVEIHVVDVNVAAAVDHDVVVAVRRQP